MFVSNPVAVVFCASTPVDRPRVRFQRAHFRAWLQARASKGVGYAGCETACPLSNWLYDRYGVRYVVSIQAYWPEGLRADYTVLPAWCQSFVRSLDVTYPLNEVSGQQALTVLDEVQQ